MLRFQSNGKKLPLKPSALNTVLVADGGVNAAHHITASNNSGRTKVKCIVVGRRSSSKIGVYFKKCMCADCLKKKNIICAVPLFTSWQPRRHYQLINKRANGERSVDSVSYWWRGLTRRSNANKLYRRQSTSASFRTSTTPLHILKLAPVSLQ